MAYHSERKRFGGDPLVKHWQHTNTKATKGQIYGAWSPVVYWRATGSLVCGLLQHSGPFSPAEHGNKAPDLFPGSIAMSSKPWTLSLDLLSPPESSHCLWIQAGFNQEEVMQSGPGLGHQVSLLSKH